MSTLKTATSALTAAALVAGIGIAVAQTQPTPASEETPADMTAQQTPPVTDPATPLDSTTRSSTATDPMTNNGMTGTNRTGDANASYNEPAPRADRN